MRLRNRLPIAIDVRQTPITHVSARGRVQRAHVLRAHERHQQPEPDRQPDEDDRRHPAEAGERLELAGVPLPFADRLRERVEETGERAAGLGLDVHGRCDVLEVARADALAHRGERLVERPAEPLLAEHAGELLRGRRRAVVGDRPAARSEGRGRRGASRRSWRGRPAAAGRTPVSGDARRPSRRRTASARPTSISSRASAGGAPDDRADDAEDEGGRRPRDTEMAGAQLQARALQRREQALRAGQSVMRALRPGEQRLQPWPRPRCVPLGDASRASTCGSSRRLSSDERRRRRPAAAAPASSSAASSDDDGGRDRAARDALGKRPEPVRPAGIRTGVVARGTRRVHRQREPVARPGRREVRELPRAVELTASDRYVAPRLRRVGDVEDAAAGRRARALPAALGRRLGAGRDRVDDHVARAPLRRSPRTGCCCEPRSRPSVSRTRTRVPVDICWSRADRQDDGVVERRPASACRARADRELRATSDDVASRGCVSASASWPNATRPARPARALAVEESCRRRFASRSGRPVIEAGVVDREHDRLRGAECPGVDVAAGRPSSSEQRGGCPSGATAVTRTSGKPSRSTRRICTDAGRVRRAPAARAASARREQCRTDRLMQRSSQADGGSSTPLASSFRGSSAAAGRAKRAEQRRVASPCSARGRRRGPGA